MYTTLWSKGLLGEDELAIKEEKPPSPSLSPSSSTGHSSLESGSMSPDTTTGVWSGGSDGEASPDIFFSKNFFFSGHNWPVSSGGPLPPLHEWRKMDQQRFLLPITSVVIPAPMDGGDAPIQLFSASSNKTYLGGASGDQVVVSSTKSSGGGRKCSRSQSKLTPLSIGQRAEKFMTSFASSSSSPSSLAGVGSGMNNKPFDCFWIDCRSSFTRKDQLIDHIDRVHIQTRKDDFSCFWHGCVRRNRPFNARYKLLIHMRVHTGHKPNKCTILGCDKAFSRLENLKIHLRSHTGERPYICPHCPKAFSNSSDRAKHQRTHFDSKPYACVFPACEKRYTDPSSLRKHVKMHYLPPKKYTTTSPVPTSAKKGPAHPRSRRKFLGASQPELKVDTIAPPPSAVHHDMAISQAAGEEFLIGDADPPLTNFMVTHAPDVAQVTQAGFTHDTHMSDQSAGGTTALAASDLDGITLGELDWISNIPFDCDFDIEIDYL